MREFKFRIWDTLKKSFIKKRSYLSSMKCDENGIAIFDYVQHPSGGFIIQQYIGYKDYEGREIYEGDIVTYAKKSSEVEFLFVVDFYDGSFTLPYIYRRVPNAKCCEVVGRTNRPLEFSCSKVIGNIFENPLTVE